MNSNCIDCNDGDIRVVGGSTPSEGTVEICFNNLWGLIGDHLWGNADTEVACRQLGYSVEGIHMMYNIILNIYFFHQNVSQKHHLFYASISMLVLLVCQLLLKCSFNAG